MFFKFISCLFLCFSFGMGMKIFWYNCFYIFFLEKLTKKLLNLQFKFSVELIANEFYWTKKTVIKKNKWNDEGFGEDVLGENI